MLKLADSLKLPLDAVTQTFAIFGKRGSGKTNGATVLVEELIRAKLPVVVLDPVDAWWGLKARFDGKGPGFPVYVFGGPHGDLPLEPGAGALIADVVARQRIPLVLSMKEWGVGERARFVTDFAKRLLQVNTDPLMVVCEEADAFIPQRPMKGEEAMLGAMDRLVRWGRQSGVGCTIVTQRSAKVNKDVTTQAETLIAFRTTGPQDRDAIDNWIKYHAGDEKREEVLSTLPALPTGVAWVWSPEWLEILKTVHFRRRQTFDSAATPKPGQKARPPKQLAPVDLERLRVQMAETVEKARADDPRELRKQLAELQRQLKSSDRGEKVTGHVRGKEKPVLTDADREVLATLATKMNARVDAIADKADAMLQGVGARAKAAVDETMAAWLAEVAAHRREFTRVLALKGFQRIVEKIGHAAPQEGLQREPPTRRADAHDGRGLGPPARRAAARHPAGQSSPGPGAADNGYLPPGEKAILTAAAQYQDGVTRDQVAVLAGYKRSARDTYISRLSQKGLVELRSGRVVATADGVATLGSDFEPLPSGDALRAYWLARLKPGEAAILKALIDRHPQAVDRDEVASGYKRSARDTYISRLRARQLITIEGRGAIRASDTLFE